MSDSPLQELWEVFRRKRIPDEGMPEDQVALVREAFFSGAYSMNGLLGDPVGMGTGGGENND